MYVLFNGIKTPLSQPLIVSEDHEEESDEDEVEDPPSETSSLEYSTNELDEILEGTSEEVLRTTLKETRPTLDTIEGFLSDIDDKAGQTLRLNTILIGLLLTVISLAFSQNLPGITDFLNLAFYFGLASSGTSIIAALLTYTRSTITPGLSVNDIEQILNNDMTEKTLLLSLVLSHGEWINKNGRVNQ